MNSDEIKRIKSYWNKQAVLNQAAAAIDPADHLGRKNAYIAHCRNLAIESALKNIPTGARVLDYGCGAGTFLTWLMEWRPGIAGYGADFSLEMLHLALTVNPELAGHITACNGKHLPFRNDSFESICTAITLIYLLEDRALLTLAREFRRTLVPGGVMVSVEQVRRNTHRQPEHHKIQRSPEELIRIFGQAGFELLEWRPIRRGRFPLIYLIRYGLIPTRWHDFIARIEDRLWRKLQVPQLDYADALFVWRAGID
jgi:SAM-dependent methyltransferase